MFFLPLADWLGLLNWRLSLDFFPLIDAYFFLNIC